MKKFIPVVARMGIIAGKAFADGFMLEIKDTPIGKILKGAGRTIRAAVRLSPALAVARTVRAASQLRQLRAEGVANPENSGIQGQQLQELKRINQRFAEQGRDF